MLQMENPQDRAMTYTLRLHSVNPEGTRKSGNRTCWKGMLVPRNVKLATDPRNPLNQYY
jgi:hypothetical protein